MSDSEDGSEKTTKAAKSDDVLASVVSALQIIQGDIKEMRGEINKMKNESEENDEYEEISDDELVDESGDPLEELNKLSNSCAVDVEENELLNELKEFFDDEEVKGPKVCEKVGSLINASLRKHPAADRVKKLVEAVKHPENIPNLKIPKTNEELYSCLNFKGKALDGALRKISLLISKALCPILKIVSDTNKKETKPLTEYMEGCNQSIRLLVASFNYLCQARKDIVKFNSSIPHMNFMSKPEHGTGEEFLFPFELVKKVQEMTKMNKIGKGKFNQNQNFKKNFYKKKNFQQKRPFLGFQPKKNFQKREQERK